LSAVTAQIAANVVEGYSDGVKELQ
jgi:hypothetical protein